MCLFCRYHLKDVIVGKIYFLLVRIKIQHMELQLIKKEITGIGESHQWLNAANVVLQILLSDPIEAGLKLNNHVVM